LKPEKEVPNRLWYKACLSPLAKGLFTQAFYPTPKQRTGAQHVFFTQVNATPTAQKVVVASKLNEAGLRVMTQDLALRCLIPGRKATKAQMMQLNEISKNLKL
jgi:hypothetical protein